MSRRRKPFVHDPKVHCPHKWIWLASDDERRKEFERICTTCGAGSTRNERRQIVAYDRDWNGGMGRKDLPEDVRKADSLGGPVTWEGVDDRMVV